MRLIFRIAFILFAFSLVFVPIKEKAQSVAAASDANSYTYLIFGMDDAAENTDAILLVSYNSNSERLSILQIPRDTYARSERGVHKINALYRIEQLSGYSKKESLDRTATYISNALGVKIDAFFGFGTKALVDGIDALGGITVTMPYDYTFTDGQGNPIFEMQKGDNLLSGRQSEYFVRHRQSYELGDLDRLDAQKLFIAGVINTLKNGVSLSRVLSVVGAVSDGVVTDASLTDAAVLFFKHRGSIASADVRYATLPGKAIFDNDDGVWYYVPAKAASSALLLNFFDTSGIFDENGVLFNCEKIEHREIYYSDNISSKIFNNNDITNEVKLWKMQKAKD